MSGSENANAVNMMPSGSFVSGNLVPASMTFMAPQQVMYPVGYSYHPPMGMQIGYPPMESIHGVMPQEFVHSANMGQMGSQMMQPHMHGMPLPMMGQPVQQVHVGSVPMSNMGGVPMSNMHAMQPGMQGMQPMQSMPVHMLSDLQGNMQGMMGNVQGAPSNMVGSVPNNVVVMQGLPSNMQGTMPSNMQGGMAGNMQGVPSNMQGNRQQRIGNMPHQGSQMSQQAQQKSQANHGEVLLVSSGASARTPQQQVKQQLQRKDAQPGQVAQNTPAQTSGMIVPQSPSQRPSTFENSTKEASRSKRKIRNIALPQKTTPQPEGAENTRQSAEVGEHARSPLTPNKSLPAGSERNIEAHDGKYDVRNMADQKAERWEAMNSAKREPGTQSSPGMSNNVVDEASVSSSGAADEFPLKRKGVRITNSKLAHPKKLSTQEEESPANAAATSSTAPAVEEPSSPAGDVRKSDKDKTNAAQLPQVPTWNVRTTSSGLSSLPETGKKNRKLTNLKINRDFQPIPAKVPDAQSVSREAPTPPANSSTSPAKLPNTLDTASKPQTAQIPPAPVAPVSMPPSTNMFVMSGVPSPPMNTSPLTRLGATMSGPDSAPAAKKGRKGIVNLVMSKAGTVIPAPIVETLATASTGSDARPAPTPMLRDTLVSKHDFLAYRNSVPDNTRPPNITKTRDTVVDEAPWRSGREPSGRDSRIPRRDRNKVQPAPQARSHFPVSAESWSAEQRRELTEDEKVIRQCRTILNKLSSDNFEKLFNQLINCGISKAEHIEALMKEVFEKATTQHGFIDLYTDLCKRLDDWCRSNPQIQADFRRILLAQCQYFFENNLKPPEGILGANVNDEEAFEREVKYKTAMLGNIKFVGRLLVTSLIASKILLQAAHQLLTIRTPITLECLCVLFMATGKAFDNTSWKFHENMKMIYQEARNLVANEETPARIRFLLADVFDCQDRQWADRV